MKHAWSIIWKIVVGLAVVGLLLYVAGWVLGGRLPFTIDSGGIHPGDSVGQHVDNQNVDAFKNIDVNTTTMSISIVTGDHYGIKADSTRSTSDITWSLNQNTSTFVLRQTVSNTNTSFGQDRVTAVITVPAGAMGTISITSDAAAVDVKADCDTLGVTTSAGLINVSGAVKNALTVQSMAGAITLSGTAGSISVTTNAGMVTVTGASPAISVHSDVGAVNVTVPGDWASTNYSLATTIGAITMTGAGAPSHDHIGTAHGGPATGYALQVKIETTVGAITVALS